MPGTVLGTGNAARSRKTEVPTLVGLPHIDMHGYRPPPPKKKRKTEFVPCIFCFRKEDHAILFRKMATVTLKIK